MTFSEQSQVLSLLAAPSSYEPSPKVVDRIDTHASIIFLAGSHAYKIKRDVDLGYLDFSSLEKRRAACERELEINRLTAPDLYLNLVAIARRADGSLALEAAGDVVEWAVKMRRFEQSDLLSARARQGTLELALMPPLARHILAFHERANVDRHVDGEKLLGDVITATVVAFTNASGVIPIDLTRDYSRALLGALGDVESLLRARARDGYIRRCHGDMHLGNIVLLEGTPTLFDAIEFSEKIATGDVLYDLAFLLMDLWHRGLKHHANVALTHYLETCDDFGQLSALQALPLFMAVRAGVRAMVTIDALPHLKGDARLQARDEAQAYFRHALEFIMPVDPSLVAIGGLSGTGKTVLSAALAPHVGPAPGALHLRSDIERKVMLGVEPNVHLGQEAYTKEIGERVYQRIIEKARLALQAGHSVIIDAVSASPGHREMIENLSRYTGVPLRAIWLEAHQDQLIKRVNGRTGDASDADASVVKNQQKWQTGPISWPVVAAGGTTKKVLSDAARSLQLDGLEKFKQAS